MSRAPRLDAGGLGAPDDAVRFLTTILEASTEHSLIVIDPAGFDGYLRKPIEPETFIGEIERFLARPPVLDRVGQRP